MPQGEWTPEQRALLASAGLEFKRTKPAPSPAPTPPDEPCLTCEKKASVPGTEPDVTPSAPTAPSAPYPNPPSPAPPTAPTSTWQEQAGILRKQLSDAVLGHQPPPVPAYPPTLPSSSPRTIAPPSPPVVAPQELHWSQLGVGYVNMPAFAHPMLYGGLSGFMRGVRAIPRDHENEPEVDTTLEQEKTTAIENIKKEIENEKKEVDKKEGKTDAEKKALKDALDELERKGTKAINAELDKESVAAAEKSVKDSTTRVAERWCLMWVYIIKIDAKETADADGHTAIIASCLFLFLSSQEPIDFTSLFEVQMLNLKNEIDETGTQRGGNLRIPRPPGRLDILPPAVPIEPPDREGLAGMVTFETKDSADYVIITATIRADNKPGGPPGCTDSDRRKVTIERIDFLK